MKALFIDLEKATKESALRLIESEKSLRETLDPAVKMDKNVEIVDSSEGIKVKRFFEGKSVIEYQQETLNNRSVELRGSIFFESNIGIGSIDTDDKKYVGLINSVTMEPALAGVYTIDGEDILHISTGIDYGTFTLKPVKKSQSELFEFLESIVEYGYLTKAIFDFLQNPDVLLKMTDLYLKRNAFGFNDVGLFCNNEWIIMSEGEEYNYATKKLELEQRFSIIQENGADTVFKNLKATELNALVTTVNQHYLQSGEILYPISMIIRNSGMFKVEPELEEIYYVSVPAIEDLKNAEYYQYMDDMGLKKVDVEISGFISGHKYDMFFENIEELLEAAEKVNKWNRPILYICFNQKKVFYKFLGDRNGASIKTEVAEIRYFF